VLGHAHEKSLRNPEQTFFCNALTADERVATRQLHVFGNKNVLD